MREQDKLMINEVIKYESSSIVKDLYGHILMTPFMLSRADELTCIHSEVEKLVRGFFDKNWLFAVGCYGDADSKLLAGHASFFILKDSVCISRVFVKEEFRNKGAGAYLIDSVCNLASRHGKLVQTMCLPEMELFYKKRGFHRVASVSGVSKHSGLSTVNNYIGNSIMASRTENDGNNFSMNPIMMLTDDEIRKIVKKCLGV